MSLSSKIEELQRRWRDSDEASEHPHVGGAFRRCADELTPLLELAKKMERELEQLRQGQEARARHPHKTGTALDFEGEIEFLRKIDAKKGASE